MWSKTKRWLYLIHRWMGIAGCLLIAMWFGSGLVMMYVPFPALTQAERLAGLPPLDRAALAGIAVSPDAAMQAAGLATFPRSLRVEMGGDGPVYRMIDAKGEPHTVSAADARVIRAVDADAALRTARQFAGKPVAWLDTIERDQWTVPNGLNPWRPLHHFRVQDDAGTELYVSARTGEVMRDTARAERFWNWLGSVPHWLYFTPIRKDPPLWRQVVLWTSGPCLAVAISGIWIGWLRLRVRRRFAHGSVAGMSPYRGWMAWHHAAGLAGALFLLFWLVSGWLSVNPNQWFDHRGFDAAALQRYGGHPAPTFPAPDWQAVAGGRDVREIRMTWVGGQPAALAVLRDGTQRVLNPGTGQPLAFDTAALARAAGVLLPGVRLADTTLQTAPDLYWYSHHHSRRFPVLRVAFDDADQTLAYIDPATGQVEGRGNDSRRLYRWLFHAAHSYDFVALTQHRPAWDVVMWLLSVVGLVMSVSGVVVGWRRLRR
ncbi:PepSY-associated TM helix domain-containing protein [Cupriavidus agavae]|uniref:PepSY-associated transmembrane protein n=1 Tax=Cupriavidus agavae TaxID=1001822 RepID=A0A4Q7S667_9BURK|nr:PepSY-associated TM helix domain-containing protein [Cupriavidus agavae]RZT41773.1 PepSY-associated transmembrane protein [Cupriavidus agavae]